jgi:phage terminase small subunit
METLAINLTPKQKKFCEEFVIDLNATQAALRSGYSKKSARVIGTENLTKPDIKEYIDYLARERLYESGVTPESVLKEVARMAFVDPGEFYFKKKVTQENPCLNCDGGGCDKCKNGIVEETYEVEELKSMSQLKEQGLSKMVKSVKPTRYGTVLELQDKTKNLELLMRYFGMTKDPETKESGESKEPTPLIVQFRKAS